MEVTAGTQAGERLPNVVRLVLGETTDGDATPTDAVLLDEGKVVNIAGLDWLYPGPDECTLCHTEAAGASLGPELGQDTEILLMEVLEMEWDRVEELKAEGVIP